MIQFWNSTTVSQHHWLAFAFIDFCTWWNMYLVQIFIYFFRNLSLGKKFLFVELSYQFSFWRLNRLLGGSWREMPPASKDENKVFIDVAAWMFNIVTSVGIIIANKALMANYGFSFGKDSQLLIQDCCLYISGLSCLLIWQCASMLIFSCQLSTSSHCIFRSYACIFCLLP